MDDNFCIVMYTHDTYQDIFNIAIKLHEKYTNEINLIVFSNKLMDTKNTHILYDDSMTYAERLYFCMSKMKISVNYIIFAQDWTFMYNKIIKQKIIDAIQIMKINDIHQLRLLKSAPGSNVVKINTNIYSIVSDGSLFSVQPAIWNVNTFKKITFDNRHLNYNNIEHCVEEYMLQFNNCFYYEGEEPFPDCAHHMSNIFPHIHATRNGKWVINQNKPFIIDIINEFNIDISIRGCF